MGSNYSKMIR